MEQSAAALALRRGAAEVARREPRRECPRRPRAAAAAAAAGLAGLAGYLWYSRPLLPRGGLANAAALASADTEELWTHSEVETYGDSWGRQPAAPPAGTAPSGPAEAEQRIQAELQAADSSCLRSLAVRGVAASFGSLSAEIDVKIKPQAERIDKHRQDIAAINETTAKLEADNSQMRAQVRAMQATLAQVDELGRSDDTDMLRIASWVVTQSHLLEGMAAWLEAAGIQRDQIKINKHEPTKMFHVYVPEGVEGKTRALALAKHPKLLEIQTKKLLGLCQKAKEGDWRMQRNIGMVHGFHMTLQNLINRIVYNYKVYFSGTDVVGAGGAATFIPIVDYIVLKQVSNKQIWINLAACDLETVSVRAKWQMTWLRTVWRRDRRLACRLGADATTGAQHLIISDREVQPRGDATSEVEVLACNEASDRARRLATAGLQHPAARRPTLHGTGGDLSRPQVEEGVEVGSHVICRLKTGWVNNAYVYGRVTRLDPIEVLGCEGRTLPVENLAWVMLSQDLDDGWLAPYDLGWQKPGRYVLMQLLTREWVSARISSWHKAQPIRTGRLMLQLEGVPSLEEVCIEDDVALLLVPHDDCQEEFGHAQPQRGGWLSDHINAAFELDTPSQGETQAEAEHKQRLRWVETSRTDGQYPIRSVWVHPSIKGGALNEFARRSRQKKAESPGDIKPEVVMLLGPPAAGKSSISRLKADQLSKDLVKTAQSLQYREEVNNDNLTDCMPGFSDEYKHVLSIKAKQKTGKSLWKKATTGVKVGKVGDRKPNSNSAAMWQWLKISIEEESVGGAVGAAVADLPRVPPRARSRLPRAGHHQGHRDRRPRAPRVLLLVHGGQGDGACHDDSGPGPLGDEAHRAQAAPLPRLLALHLAGEARFDRQAGRARKEQEEGKLLGGNLTSNLVDIHYHAQQAETNITKLLGCLRKGVRATDSSSSSSDEEGCCSKGERASSKEVAEGVRQKTHVKVDHFLVIDNEGKEPKVLIDFSSESGSIDVENIKRELKAAVEKAATSSRLFEKEWDAFDPYLFR
ncbi:unnamed protein product, partial [Prorocentrum cordatum]